MIPTRTVVGIMVFSACIISYVLRVSMSINIISMVEPREGKKDGNHPPTAECLKQEHAGNVSQHLEKFASEPNVIEKYDWNSETQGLVLGSYFWGYVLTSVPGGLLAERFGPLMTVGISTLIAGVFHMVIPFVASYHYGIVITIQFLTGALGGVVFPSLQCLISRWAPPNEKGKFASAMLGGTLGTILAWSAFGTVIEQYGWSWGFFLPGVLAILWCVLWHLFVSDTPESHPRISDEEKMYIISSLGDSVNNNVKVIPPYKKMFLSVPFWAYVVLNLGNEWALYLLLTAGPKYMTEVLGFNLGRSGILASLPHVARLLFGFIFAFIGDFLRERECLRVTATRKIFVIFSHIIPGLFMLSQTLVGCNALLAVVLLTVSLGMNGASTLTSMQNSQDLASNYSGSIYGLVNCFASITGFLTPMLTGYITKDNNGLNEWHKIFWIGGSAYIGSGIIFAIFGSGEIQKWNFPDARKPEKDGIENPGFTNTEELTDIISNL